MFNGENSTYFKLLKDNLSWLLDKYKYDYSQEQVYKILDLIHDHHELIVKSTNQQLKVKLDHQLQMFIAE